MVDDGDYDYLNQWKWIAYKGGKTYYACRRIRSTGRHLTMHREIMNTPKGMCTDHINRNGLDNRKENLRICTYSQNQANTEKYEGVSKYKGVCLHSRGKKYVASLKHNYKYYYLGVYDNEIDAAKAYDKAAKKIYKEFAVLNFPDDYFDKHIQNVDQ